MSLGKSIDWKGIISQSGQRGESWQCPARVLSRDRHFPGLREVPQASPGQPIRCLNRIFFVSDNCLCFDFLLCHQPSIIIWVSRLFACRDPMASGFLSSSRSHCSKSVVLNWDDSGNTPTGDIWQYMETFLVVAAGGVMGYWCPANISYCPRPLLWVTNWCFSISLLQVQLLWIHFGETEPFWAML